MHIKLYVLTIVFAFFTTVSYAQLPDGSIVPDFTFTDINNNTQNLYTYLNEGKYVAIDVSTTWCIPCWNYHQLHVMDSLYTLHDSSGDRKWKVLFIEGDASTDLADLQGTGSNTVGDWIQGSNYSIIDPAGTGLSSFLSGYNISYFPTLYLICPNKRVIQGTLNTIQRPYVYNWEYAANTLCTTVGIEQINNKNAFTIYPDPAWQTLTLYFDLDNASSVNLQIINAYGQLMAKTNLGDLYHGDHAIKYDISRFAPGVYLFCLYTSGGYSVVKRVSIL